MTVVDLLAGAFLFLGVTSLLVCALGVLLIDDVFERLHFAGAASTIPPIAVVVAIALGRGPGQLAGKALITAVVLLVTGPVLTHATARAAHLRRTEGVDAVTPRSGSTS